MLSFLSSVSLVTSDDIAQFAILYTIGQVLNIFGSVILVTPKKQWKTMTTKGRWLASLLYLLSIVATLVVACTVPEKAFTYICLGIQVVAYYWYMLSFIPCGHTIVKKFCKSLC